jgi:hypothetical protein
MIYQIYIKCSLFLPYFGSFFRPLPSSLGGEAMAMVSDFGIYQKVISHRILKVIVCDGVLKNS